MKQKSPPKQSMIFPEEASTSAHSWWQFLLPPAIISFLSGIFYHPSLNYDFQFDDLANITKFYNIRHNNFTDIFLHNQRWISYWINSIHYKIGKFNPFSYRLLNVCIHTWTSMLIFYFLYSALSNLRKNNFFKTHAWSIAFLTAGIYLLHPVQTQTVSYVIQGQLEGLAGFFAMSMSLCFLWFTKVQSTIGKIVLAFLLFFLTFIACGTKEIIIVSPLLILLVDWFFVAQGNFKSIKQRAWVHAIIITIVVGMFLYFLKPTFFINIIGLKTEARNNIGNILTENAVDKITPYQYCISQFKVILHYLGIFIWPFTISVEYDWKLVKNFFSPDCIGPFMALIVLAAYILHLLRKNPINPVAFGFLWFFVSIAPRSSIIPSSELLADYKTYLGSMALIFLIASSLIYLFELVRKYRQQLPIFTAYGQVVCLTIVFCSLGFLTYNRNKVWRSSLEFWGNMIENAPGKARAYNNYGVALSEKGQIKESILYYNKAIAMDNMYPDPCNNLSVAYAFIGEIDKAIEVLKKAIRIQPNYPEGYNNLASFLITKQDYDQAEKSLNVALQLRPFYGKAWLNKGKIFVARNNHEEAFTCFKNACMKGDLDNEIGFNLYGSMAMSLKKYDDAIVAFTKLLEIKPTAEFTLNLASAYFLNNNYEKAKEVYLHLINQNPTEVRAIYNLGEVFIRLNDFNQALVYFKQAQTRNCPVQHLPLRIAYCLNQLKRFGEAEKILNDLIMEPNIPEQMRNMAKLSLVELSQSKKSKGIS